MDTEHSPESAESQSDLLGNFLISMERTDQTSVFDHALIVLCSNSPTGGIMGLIVNSRFQSPSLADLFSEFNIKSTIDLSHVSVHCGGPVEGGRGFILHSADYKCDGTQQVNKGIALTVNQHILIDLARGRGPARYLAAMGFACWEAEQLEDEIERNMWITAPADPDIVFSDKDDEKWNMALEGIGVTPGLLSIAGGNA